MGVSSDGLEALQAARRLVESGPNEIVRGRVRWHRILLRQFRSPFLYLLIVAALIAWALGETIDALMIAGFVLINAGLGFAQEYHSERAVELLRTFVRAKARVRRAGKETWVESRDLVPGDVVVVETGDMIHADVRFIGENDLALDESVLTGESAPVKKQASALSFEATEPYQAINVGFAGTTVVSGHGVGVVIATGVRSQIGELARMTRDTDGKSNFEKNVGSFSAFILRIILITLAAVFVANLVIKGDHANVPDLLIFSIALAVSVIPEALPLVMTTTLSRGALRLAKEKVVVKRLSAIEDLGSIEVLCTDKTGTLTENKLEVADVFGHRHESVLFDAAAGSSFLGERRAGPNNAFDIAIWDRLAESDRRRVQSAERSHEIPFDPAKRWNSVVVDGRLVVRGSPDELAALCDDDCGGMREWSAEQGKKGRRVLAVAARTAQDGDWHAEDGPLAMVGAISFVDPLKKTAAQAIAHAKRLGVAVKILTGDSREVAAAVSREVGLISSNMEVMTGEEWEALPEADRATQAESHSVFARVSPRQKYLIIQTLQETGEVGFLGEGINDAPALKIASVGIVVSGASDIAREAADIVLLQQSLDVIIRGIREGRSVFANTVKYVKATLASNFGNFLAVATATLLVDYLPMLPVQILLLNLLSDFPMIAIATDAVDADELRRPRVYDLRDIVYSATVLGVVSTVFDFIFFGLFSRISPEVLHTNWFIGSILTELVLIFSIRTRLPFWRAVHPARPLFWLSAVAAVATIWIPFTAFGERVFRFISPSSVDVWLILGIVVVYFVVTEMVKLASYRLASGLAKTAQDS
ncbi:hypothetical protein A2304_01070 [Candidatus Uhrbacteria bacterium RIFOXYB2_FULL_57_15]|uniref:Cation-transporting P-type ATPase N-terminal domain-containing protein n=1 Tax=Candidatus Uhrbacteria bacterium RIFOXYB2_FULL_57_15 TaxID=1802422 RepID=A0A1F7W7K4_9BACT|nr:MAG: hypothetical protein A2304_01070 [Candidatus Uhrbacteria bacterium RIFOXYB2_FULL_57_15]OGL99978.1 MAG: hypothetical protein A2501_04400 [Candidatus Uhrbacteria bacterium RIFOXYC12_FULL_57_11]